MASDVVNLQGLGRFVRLLRLHQPTGIAFLLLPCWWSLSLIVEPSAAVVTFALFGAGAVIMRSAGCLINDLVDRRLDRDVDRTRLRPLATGEVSVPEAGLILLLLLIMGLVILLQFNHVTIALGIAALALVVIYPWAKRVTGWPQVVLGLTFNMGALMAWSAVRGSLGFPAVALYVGGILWTLAYDTIYACQDKADDPNVGIQSSALRLGIHVRPAVAAFYGGAFALWTTAGLCAGGGWMPLLGLMSLSAAFAGHTLWTWDPDDPARCARAFRRSALVGALVLAALMTSRAWT